MKRKIVRKIRNNHAVSEVLDNVLLLGIAVSLFSILTIVVFSMPFNPTTPNANIIGYVEDNNIIITHQGGERLDLDTKIIIRINDADRYEQNAQDNLSLKSIQDGFWNLGESIIIDASLNPINMDITNSKVDLFIVDEESKSMVMMGTIQEAF